MSTTRVIKTVFREIDRAQKQAARERLRREREFIREQKRFRNVNELKQEKRRNNVKELGFQKSKFAVIKKL